MAGTYHHGNLRIGLIQAALELINEKGGGFLTIREVAKRAGVSHTAPYRHFKNKEELLGAVAIDGFRLMIQKMKNQMAIFKDQPILKFQASGVAYMKFALAHPAHFRVMFGSRRLEKSRDPKLKQASATSLGLLLDCIKDCQAKGEIRSGNAMEMALAAWSMVHGFAMLSINNHVREAGAMAMDLDDMMDVVIRTLYSGMSPNLDKPEPKRVS